jgi:hypothetical protein
MRSSRIKRVAIVQVLAVASVLLTLPLASQAAGTKQTQAAVPGVSTGAVTHVLGTTATLNGVINPHTLATTYHFAYGPTNALAESTPTVSLPAGTVGVKVTQTVTGFLAGYHYRLVASNEKGLKLGRERIFNPKIRTKKTDFVLPKTFAATPLGGTFTLSGTLMGSRNAGRELLLQASPYPYRTAFAAVGAPIFTSANGAFTFRVANMRTSTKFRVITAGAAPVTSFVVPAQVQVRVVLKVRASSRKGLVRLYGTVTPAEVGAHVLVQLEKPPKAEKNETREKPGRLEKPGKGGSEEREKGPKYATKFKTVVKPGAKAISRFSIVVNITATGRYRVFVELPIGPLVSGASESVTLHAPTAIDKKKKKA